MTKLFMEMTPEEEVEAYKKMREEEEAEAKKWKEKKAEYEAEKNYPFSCKHPKWGELLVIKKYIGGEIYEAEIRNGFIEGVGGWVRRHSDVACWKDKKTIEIRDYFLSQMFFEECENADANVIYDNN